MPLKRKYKLLLVEDNPDVRDLTKELLELEDYEVYCAANGQEALDFLKKDPTLIDLILLDLMMPVMDGYQFRREQLEDPRIVAIPVIVLSADGDAKSKMEVLKTQGFYTKASGIEGLLEVVKRNCELIQ